MSTGGTSDKFTRIFRKRVRKCFVTLCAGNHRGGLGCLPNIFTKRTPNGSEGRFSLHLSGIYVHRINVYQNIS